MCDKIWHKLVASLLLVICSQTLLQPTTEANQIKRECGKDEGEINARKESLNVERNGATVPSVFPQVKVKALFLIHLAPSFSPFTFEVLQCHHKEPPHPLSHGYLSRYMKSLQAETGFNHNLYSSHQGTYQLTLHGGRAVSFNADFLTSWIIFHMIDSLCVSSLPVNKRYWPQMTSSLSACEVPCSLFTHMEILFRAFWLPIS